jgi:D-alanyl-lipoteichoic acid acyltransferase DltB (MBOAT superfamily)
MLFHTWLFLVFFAIAWPGYLLLRRTRARDAWLLAASYVFYGCWNPLYLLLLFSSTAVDWLLVVGMMRSRHRKRWLVLSLVANFGVLAFFKYADFATENLNALLHAAGLAYALPMPDILLPVGISFHTFRSMSYTIDAYYGKVEPERSLVRFAAYVAFFPMLIAGPIERARNLLPQFRDPPPVTGECFTEGLSLFLVGFFKKVALADYLALYVDKVYAAPAQFQAPALLLATFAFAWQIYFDFSGYSDMACGLARTMGFRLSLNFNNPYTATSLGDFWNRWHISLSSWFKDYVYIPLGGNRGGEFNTYRNMFVTMVLSGLWHGAAWTFVIWGALHAFGRALTRELERTRFYRDNVPTLLKQLFVFSFVCLAWVFFRARNVGDAWLILSRIVTSGWEAPRFPLLLLALVLAVWAYQLLYGVKRGRELLELSAVRMGAALVMVAWLLVVAQPSSKAFIYFQF